MRKDTTQALTCWAVGMGLLVTLLFAFLGAPRTADGAGEAIGRGFGHTGLSALCVWFFARKKDWSWPRFVGAYIVAFIVLAIASTMGNYSAAAEREPWPFEVTFPDGWKVEHLSGASSAPQDASLGVRDIARKGTELGAPVIQLACVKKDVEDPPLDLEKMSMQIAARLEQQYGSANARTSTVDSDTKLSRFPTRSIVTTISLQDDAVIRQESLVALTEKCLFSAQVAALPSEFDDAEKAFRHVIESIRFR